MKVIGFANKFYTLWEVTEETRSLGNGRSYMITHFNYVKNISFDKETAQAKYPDANIDENLKGRTISFETKKEIFDNIDTFRFGKYSDKKINEVNDVNYTAWYWDNTFDEEHKKYVSKFLEANGYEIRTNSYINYCREECINTYLVSPEELEIEKERNEGLTNVIELLKSGNELEFMPTSNINYYGEYFDGNVIYKFAEIKENYYNGYNYYLPVLKGKTKRIKNKTVIVKSYTYEINENGVTVNIIDFEIKK